MSTEKARIEALERTVAALTAELQSVTAWVDNFEDVSELLAAGYPIMFVEPADLYRDTGMDH